MTARAGNLYIVATPIGNLEDLAPRARAILQVVDLVAAEDTRHTGQLLKTLGIAKQLISLHEHNESTRVAQLLDHLQAGKSIALVSDAGTPLISDPGFEVVRAAVAADINIVPVPGACALVVALCAAGMPTDRFVFEGFLPAREQSRRERLLALAEDTRTSIFYESPHRIASALADIAAVFGSERRVVVARELTKQFESFYRGTAAEVALRAARDPDMQRGEIVIVVEGASTARTMRDRSIDDVLRVLLEELPVAQAAKLASRLTGGKRDELYRRALELSGKA